eukprot:759289-Hanusia_phi.AAC.5
MKWRGGNLWGSHPWGTDKEGYKKTLGWGGKSDASRVGRGEDEKTGNGGGGSYCIIATGPSTG